MLPCEVTVFKGSTDYEDTIGRSSHSPCERLVKQIAFNYLPLQTTNRMMIHHTRQLIIDSWYLFQRWWWLSPSIELPLHQTWHVFRVTPQPSACTRFELLHPFGFAFENSLPWWYLMNFPVLDYLVYFAATFRVLWSYLGGRSVYALNALMVTKMFGACQVGWETSSIITLHTPDGLSDQQTWHQKYVNWPRV